MSRSYPTGERGMWRMYCDSCPHVDPDRFPRNECPPLERYVAKGWLIGKVNDRCPTCRYRADLPKLEVHSVMSQRPVIGPERMP
jgi:hypothetical protein